MLYDTVLPEELVRMFTPNWAFGDVFLTEGAQEMIEAGVDVDSLFQRVMNGDYGLISADASDHQMTVKARIAGRRFCAVFKESQGTLYFSMNDQGRTVVCRMDER